MLVLLLLGLIGPGIERTGPDRPFVPEPYPDPQYIRFANGLGLDTRFETGAAPQDLLPLGSIWLANLNLPPNRQVISALRSAGLEPLGYYYPQTIACRSAGTCAGQALTVPGVRWLGQARPETKLAPELIGTATSDGPLMLSLWPNTNPEPVLDAIVAGGGTIEREGDRTIRFRSRPAAVHALAQLDEVQWLQSCDPTEDFNAAAQWVIQSGWRSPEPDAVSGRPAWQRGIRGRGVIVGNVGSGIETDHEQFLDPQYPLPAPGVFPHHRKIAAYKLYPGARFGDPNSFHGSGVASTLCGDDSVNGNLTKSDGIAPDARVYFLDVANSSGVYVFDDDYTELLDSIRLSRGMPEPVTQLSGSFGSSLRPGYYRLQEATLDNVAWQSPGCLPVWAAGNSGGSRFRIGHPGCAKNCLTVGATGNGVLSNLVASFSSRGPTRDMRIKPEVVAPGEYVTTVSGPGPRSYALRSGTSYAAPTAHGALALVIQYLRDGWFPTGLPDPAHRLAGQSAALYRAFAVLAADPAVETAPPPSDAAGWGRLDLSRLLHFAGDTIAFSFVDDQVGLATGSLHEYRFQVSSRRPLTLVLCWTDTAAAPEIDVAIVNDLDLEVVSPDGNYYRGNQLIEGQSRTNPVTWDTRNNVEVFQLHRPIAGEWTIRVRGRSVFTERQPYALALRGTIAGLPGVTDAETALTRAPGVRWARRGRRMEFRLPPGAIADFFDPEGRLTGTSTADPDGRASWDTGRVPVGVYFVCLRRAGEWHLDSPGQKIIVVD